MSTIRLLPGGNDHQRIQDALNQHEVVVLDYGAFYDIHGLLMPSGRQLIGQGIGATVIHRRENYGDCLIMANNGGDQVLRDLTIMDEGNMPTNAMVGNPSVRFFGCQQAVIERVGVRNIFRMGIQLAGCQESRISYCVGSGARGVGSGTSGMGGHAFSVWAPDTGPLSRDNVVEHCLADGCWRTGVYATGTTGLRISENTIIRCNPKAAVQAGIEQGGSIGVAHGCRDVLVEGNIISDGGLGTQGIEVDVTENGKPGEPPCRGIVIRGNTVRDQGVAGVLIYCDPNTPFAGSDVHCAISDNIIRNTNRKGSNYYGGIFVFDRIRGVNVIGNLVEEDSDISHPGIRVKGPHNDAYWIDGNQVSMTGASVAQTMGAALDTSNVVGAKAGRIGRNLLTVRGRLV